MDLIPIFDITWLNYLTNLFIEIGEKHKYLNFFIGMFLESTGVPFAAMPAFASTGYLLSNGQFNFWWAVIVGGLGNALGSSVSYGLGYFFGDLIRKHRRSHQVFEREEKLQDYIRRSGTRAIFLAQLFGFTRVFISFPAGLLKMDFRKFFTATFVGGMVFVLYFALGTMYVMDLYEKFVYPYIGLSFISLGFIIGFGYIITHFSVHFGKRAHAKLKEKKNGEFQDHQN